MYRLKNIHEFNTCSEDGCKQAFISEPEPEIIHSIKFKLITFTPLLINSVKNRPFEKIHLVSNRSYSLVSNSYKLGQCWAQQNKCVFILVF